MAHIANLRKRAAAIGLTIVKDDQSRALFGETMYFVEYRPDEWTLYTHTLLGLRGVAGVIEQFEALEPEQFIPTIREDIRARSGFAFINWTRERLR